MPDPVNPKYVIFNLFAGIDHIDGSLAMAKTVSNSTVYDLNDAHLSRENDSDKVKDYIIDCLRQHVKKYGTIDEIKFAGHGKSQEMGAGFSGYYEFSTKEMLTAIAALEKELGKKITNRIVFKGCDTFADIGSVKDDKDDIAFYRDYAKTHAMEIVGSTSGTWALIGGRYVQFTPQGIPIRDKVEDSPHNPLARMIEDQSWAPYHLNHTPAEADKAVREEMLNLGEISKHMPPMEAYTRLQKAKELEDLTRKTRMAIGDGHLSAVIATSDDTLHAYGDAHLHVLQEKEKTNYLKRIENIIKTGQDQGQIVQNVILEIEQIDWRVQNVNAVMLDNHKQVLLITDNGGYEVVDMGGGQVPASKIPARPRSKTESIVKK